jgi:hypothetical protein
VNVSDASLRRFGARRVWPAVLAVAVGITTLGAAGCGGSNDNSVSSEARERIERSGEEAKKGVEKAKEEVRKGFSEAGKATKQGIEKGKAEAEKGVEEAKKQAQKYGY